MSLSILLGVIFIICASFITDILCQEVPRLNPLVFPSSLVVGSRARVVCVAYLGDQPLDFEWKKDGQPLVQGRVQQIAETDSELVLEPLGIQHTGNYTCYVKNAYGSDKVTAFLFVKAPPMWVKEPSDVKVGVGSSASIDCQANGSPPVKVKWQRRTPSLGNLVDITPSSRLHVHANNTLLLTNVQKSEDGLYICEASNGIGESIRKSIEVTVFDYPRVQQLSEYVTVERGSTAFLSCIVKGDEPLSLYWIRNRRSLSDWPDVSNRDAWIDRSRMKFTEQRQTDGIKFTLTVSPTEMSDEGLYVCSAKNEFGSDEKEIRLLLVERPHQPENIEVVDVWSRSVRLRWSVPSSGNSPILHYTVEYWSPSGVHLNYTVPSTSTSCILRDLTPFTVYKFQLWAANSVGVSEPSKQMHFTTAKEEPSSPPVDLQIVGSGSNFARLTWKPPPREDWNGEITGYYVGYRQSSSKFPFTYNTAEAQDDEINYVLRGLQKSTSYTVSVKAFNEIGSGPLSQELSFRTHNHDPPPRPSLMVKSIGSTHIQLQWYVTEEGKTNINAYTLTYRPVSGKWHEIMIPDASQNTFTLTNLESGITYQVFLTSESSVGTSEPSDTATIQTMAEPIYHSVVTSATPIEGSVDEFTQTLYIVIPIAVSTVIIVIVIVVACVYVYSRRPIGIPSHSEILPDKNFTYMSTVPRRRDAPMPVCVSDLTKMGSPYSTVPLTRFEHEEEEPIYESVMEEIRCKIKQRAYEDEMKIGSGTIV